MSAMPLTSADDCVSRRRLERERLARLEAERLLEGKARELYEANQALRALAEGLTRKAAELEKQRALADAAAKTDALTGLLSRRGWVDALDEAYERLEACGGMVVTALVNIEQFKRVNDAVGHLGADRLLATLGRRLRCVAPEALIARLDGDQFGVLLAGERIDAQRLGADLQNAVRADAIVDGRAWRLDARIGLVAAPEVARSAADLHAFADAAVLEAKLRGAGAVVAFDEPLRRSIAARKLKETELRDALLDGAFEPWLQPIVEPGKNRIHSLEVLARWRCGEEVRAPGAFLPLAEELGLVRELDRQVMERAFASTRDWLAAGEVSSLSVNVSPKDLGESDVIANLLMTLARFGLPPSRLVIELTETAIFEDYDLASELLTALERSGSRVALDDFGTGYSNLRALARLPIDYVKIDRSLVSEIETDPRVLALCSASIALARALDLGVVAEGVETQTQAHLLRALGCRRMQGYLFFRPMSVGTLGETLAARRGALASEARSA